MIISELRVHLKSEEEQEMPYNYGHDMLKQIIELASQSAPSNFANELSPKNKKFSISRLQIDNPSENNPYSLNKDDYANFRIFATDPYIIEEFDRILSNSNNFNVFGLNFSIDEISFRTIDLNNRPALPNPVHIFFVTPVSFVSNGIENPFPTPIDFFSSLTRIWDIWFPALEINSQDLLDKMDEIHVKYAKGSVNRIPYEDVFVNGWRGLVKIDFSDNVDRAVLSKLIRLGSLAGVGRLRNSGFGRYRLIFQKRENTD